MENIEKINKNIAHKAVVAWDERKKAFIGLFNKQIIEVATVPAQLKKHKEAWTPEELFLASLKGFLKEAFVDHAKRNSFEFLSYESKAEGVIEKVGDKLMFTEIEIRPHIVVYSSSQIEKAKELIRAAKEDCFIFNSLASMIMVYPEIQSQR